MYYVEVNQLRTLWNCCGLVSVHQTAVIRSLHCCTIAIVIHLAKSRQTVGPPYVPMVVNFTSDHTHVKEKFLIPPFSRLTSALRDLRLSKCFA